MTRKFLPLFLLLFSFFAGHISLAQKFQVRKISSKDGLSQNMVRCIEQDYHGFIWLGTKGGLNRYDGHTFKVYQHDSFDSTSIIANDITAILEDNQHHLWVGTHKGLCLYNELNETFTPMAYGQLSIEQSTAEVTKIVQDQFGNIWVTTKDNNLIRYIQNKTNPKQYSSSNIWHLSPRVNTQFVTYPCNMVIDDSNNIWVVSQAQYWKVIQYHDGDSVQIQAEINENHYGFDGARQFMFKDEKGTLWFHNKHAQIFNQIGDTLTPPISYAINMNDNAQYGIKSMDHKYGLQDAQGNYWIGGYKSQTLVYDSAGERFHEVYIQKTESSIAHSTPLDFQTTCIFEDNLNNIWIGSSGYGVFVYSPLNHPFDNKPISEKIATKSLRAMANTTDGNLWFSGGGNYLSVYNHKTQSIQRIKHPNVTSLDNSNPNHHLRFVFDIDTDSKQNLWVLTSFGLNKITYVEDSITSLQFLPLLSMDELQQKNRPYPLQLYIDSNDVIYAVSHTDLFIYNTKTNGLQKLPLPKNNHKTSTDSRYNPIITSFNDTILWISNSSGVYQFHTSQSEFFTFTESFPQLNGFDIRSIDKDPIYPNIIWIAAYSQGLIKMDTVTGEIHFFNKNNLLFDNVIYAALSDQDSSIWMSSNNGLMQLNVVNNLVKHYTVNDGLQNNEFNDESFYRADNNELFFGGISGINRFYPHQLEFSNETPGVIFTQLSINNTPLHHNNNPKTIDKPIFLAPEIILEETDRVINLWFSSLDYANPTNCSYAYKLENFDSEWQLLGSKRNVTFTNLDPGTYTLKVKATNSSGIWSPNETSIKLLVNPPWFQTWWAYSLYVLILLGLGYLFYRIQLNIQLKKQETTKLAELDELKTKFFTNISHEFRTPLTLISGIPALLKKAIEKGETNQVQKNISIIEQNSNQMLELVNQIMDLSKLEAHAFTARNETINLYAFCENYKESFESAAQTKGISLEFTSFSTSIPIKIDLQSIQHILRNLISNAIKFTNKGVVKIIISDSQEYVLLEVKDTGVGISQEDLPYIFDRFYQVEKNQSKSNPGTGIGLALTKELIKAYNGDISVNSKANQGTSFTVSFLKSKMAITQEFESTKPIENLSTKVDMVNPELDKPVVLVVEDNTHMLHLISETLYPEYQIIQATNGDEGYQKATDLIPDFIISDWMMPKLSGLELIQKLKNNQATSHIPCMLLTAKADSQSHLQGYSHGADAYLTKPFNANELKLRIQALIDRRNAIRIHILNQSKGEETSPSLIQENAFVLKIRELVCSNLHDSSLNGDWIALQVFLSRSQLNRKLNALSGKNLTQFIRAERILKAKELLQSTDKTISEIAYEVGFEDPAYFSRVFAKECSLSPQKFRDS